MNEKLIMKSLLAIISLLLIVIDGLMVGIIPELVTSYARKVNDEIAEYLKIHFPEESGK